MSALALAAISLGATEAQACGGFFCSASAPVNQAAERIIFAQDDDGNVTQIVEVMYEGDAEKFAWVLPVPGTPTPGVSSVQVFDRLQQATNPTYQLINEFPNSCGLARSGALGSSDGAEAEGGFGPEPPSVVVLDAGTVGPFDFVTISVNPESQDPAEVALEWLTDNGYDLTADAADVLGPYLANGLNLIAFRLQKGAESGSIRPISLEYQANAMAIPIRPTAVAAADDMPIMVWTLGRSRAVSTNYRALELNELLIDWTNPAPTYNDVVIAAANEAGGQGFVTEFAGDADPFADMIAPGWQQLDGQGVEDLPFEDALESLSSRYGSMDGYVDAVRETVPLRDGITPAEFAECTRCYFFPNGEASGAPGEMIADSDPIYTLDRAEFLAAIQVHVLDPIEDAADLFRTFDKVTRFYTTMSAEEMTKDPIFEFNPDLDDLSNQHTATREVTCEGPSGDWKVTLPDGRKVYGTGNSWPYSLDDTDMAVNLRVLQYSTSGTPEVVTDNRASIQSIHESTRAGSGKKNALKGCAMSSGPAAPSLAWLGGLLAAGLLFARRHTAGNRAACGHSDVRARSIGSMTSARP